MLLRLAKLFVLSSSLNAKVRYRSQTCRVSTSPVRMVPQCSLTPRLELSTVFGEELGVVTLRGMWGWP